MPSSDESYRYAALAIVGLAAAIPTVALFFVYRENSRLSEGNSELRKELERQEELRQVERQGRVRVQQQLRDSLVEKSNADGYSFKPIGYIESPFLDRRGTPRQPVLVPAARGIIRFDKSSIHSSHFEDFKQFSHIWILFVFHDNTDTGSTNKAAKIKPPRLNGQKVSTLATRSPHRPNNIGLSVCEISSIGSDYIEVKCLDMVDGTPVLDGKLLIELLIHCVHSIH